MKITLKQLEVFVAIAKLGNMSQAAEQLYLSQSACSMALATMEDQLGGQFFDRHGKKLILNDRGNILLNKAINILSQVSELQDVMLGKPGTTLTGKLIVGASTTIGNYLLPTIIGEFANHFPKTTITLRVGNTAQVIRQLLNFDVDVGLIEGNCYEAELEVIPWHKDELIIIAAPTHHLARKNKLTPHDLHNEKWLLRETGSGTREKVEIAIGTKIMPFLELGQTEAIKQAVQAGIGISCLSKATVKDALDHGSLVRLKTPFLELNRDFYIVHHKQKYRTLLLSKFLNKVQGIS